MEEVGADGRDDDVRRLAQPLQRFVVLQVRELDRDLRDLGLAAPRRELGARRLQLVLAPARHRPLELALRTLGNDSPVTSRNATPLTTQPAAQRALSVPLPQSFSGSGAGGGAATTAACVLAQPQIARGCLLRGGVCGARSISRRDTRRGSFHSYSYTSSASE